jgi:hypothetical protein
MYKKMQVKFVLTKSKKTDIFFIGNTDSFLSE